MFVSTFQWRNFILGFWDLLHSMIQNARKNRSTKAPESDSELVHFSKKIYDEIMGVSTQKSKYSRWFKLSLVSRGKVAHLLKEVNQAAHSEKSCKDVWVEFWEFW